MFTTRRLASACIVMAALALTTLPTRGQTGPLVQASNLTYLGSFKLPTVSGNGFSYGGTAISYNPANNSLFVVGHVYDQEVAEVAIPAIGGTAKLIQPLTNVINLNGLGGSGSRRIGGTFVHNGRLYATGFIFYDASQEARASHYYRSLTLNSGSTTGPVRVGTLNPAFYAGYMGAIPPEWQSKFGGTVLTGNCCLSIISRTSYGPAAFAINPENLSGSAYPLVYYTSSNQTLGEYGDSGSHPVFNGTTRITGIVFPEGTSTVLFFGVTGIGNYCYGEASECNDPAYSYKGEHAYPYVSYVWAYDANDLAAVKSGSREPWSVTPYATWQLKEMGNPNADFGVGGAAYDPATGRIFVAKKYGDGDRPLIYVYQVNNSTSSDAPRPPSNVRFTP